MSKSTNYFDVLSALKQGSEVNVHTKDKTYYDAVFCELNLNKGIVILKLDQFYESGGYLTSIPVKEIISIDLPLSFQEALKRE